ncbi:uncharacterized protein [Triticum aestivum]|uniref:uncharacterized protein n=1 Tax=Triticum aestivum TaxID=4565 RepID=UPI001D00A49D|nr:uncharacterized protein LOC123050428 [Triticum aestivum]
MVPGLDDPNYVSVVRLLGGGLAGVTAASVTYPLDVVRTRLATQLYRPRKGWHRGADRGPRSRRRDAEMRGSADEEAAPDPRATAALSFLRRLPCAQLRLLPALHPHVFCSDPRRSSSHIGECSLLG